MRQIEPESLARWAGGIWKGGVPSGISGLANDSRSVGDGEMFTALRRDTRDGHDYVDAAEKGGASCALVERWVADVELPQLVVESVDRALIEMARGYRETWAFPVVGVTGSCGKTTCKELLVALFGSERTHATRGNLNNLIGVPMSVLRTQKTDTRIAVLEAGISEPGEMEQLARAIDPDWVIFTAIGPAHLEDLGSESNVALEKGKLASGSRVQGIFAGESCERYAGYLGGTRVQVVKESSTLREMWSYRAKAANGVTKFEQQTDEGVWEFEYKGAGKGLASNVALAVALAKTIGLSREEVQAGLLRWKGSRLRNEWREVGSRKVYVDCYNANPLSMDDSLQTFIENTPEAEARLFLIGCMEELGKDSSIYHEELGINMPFRPQDLMLVIGGEASSVLRGMKNVGHNPERCMAIQSLEDAKRLVAEFSGNLFLKGSRRYRLEEVLESLPVVSRDACEGGARC